jgi:hypothetical protein
MSKQIIVDGFNECLEEVNSLLNSFKNKEIIKNVK